MIATPFLVSLVFAQPTYSPGVKVGDSVTFGKISAIWMSNSTPPRFIQQFNHTVSVQETITSASGKIVTANQTFNYENGTSETFTGSVNVQDGNGTLGIFVIAGELSAGDQVYRAPSPSSLPRIGETVTKPYANALRSINVVNATDNLRGPQSQILLHWDVNTGLLLEVLEKASYPSNKYSLYFEVTSTNVWQPSSIPDFGFDTIQHSSMSLHLGEPGICVWRKPVRRAVPAGLHEVDDQYAEERGRQSDACGQQRGRRQSPGPADSSILGNQLVVARGAVRPKCLEAVRLG